MRSQLVLWFAALPVLVACRGEDPPPPPTGGTAEATTAESTAAPTTAAAAPAAPAAPPRSEVPAGMVAIPAGVFLMGGESPENTPVHEAIVARFFLDENEVTMGAYDGCVKDGGCKPPRVDNPFCNTHFPDRGDHPANCVDYLDAEAFCRRAGKRLPTETEWEYAARGGGEQRLYSWGNEEPDRQRSCYMHEGGSCAVGTHPAGAFGLFDMTGNVWEWTATWYATYPEEPATGLYRVYRGGSWSRRFAKWMRNDLRNRYRPEEHSASVGFRCAMDATPRVCPKETEARDGRCVRVSGVPLCPKGEAFAEGKCRPGGLVPAYDPMQPTSAHTAPGAPAPAPRDPAPSVAAAAAPTPLGRSRSPRYDDDCAKIFPGAPLAYSFTGGSFHDREPMVRAAGCKKRDVGVGWTSACCAN